MLKIGIVFSGALSKGAFHLGFIEAFNENLNGHKLKAVSGTSSGAVIAYALATNQIELTENLWLEVNGKHALSLWYKVVFRRLIKKNSKRLIKENDNVKLPLYITSFKVFPKFKFRYIKFEGKYTTSWNKIIEGSIGFPVVTGMPVFYKKGLYVDGGVVDNIPLNPLLKENLDVIFVLHFDNKFNIRVEEEDEVIVINLVLSTYADFKLKSFNYSTDYVLKMRAEGYRYSNEILKRLLRHNNIDDIRKEAVIIVKEENRVRKKKKSLDSIPTISNRVFRKRRDRDGNVVSVKDF